MNQKQFQQVWFADEKRNRSITKMITFADRGSLEAERDSLVFRGEKLKLQISNIKEISMARQRINWVTYLITNVLLIIGFAFLVKALPNVYSFSFMLPVLLVANVFGLIVGYSTKWVRVEYSDDNNRNTQAFFADGSSFGWSGIFGGTKKMYQMLKKLLKSEKSAAS